MAAAPGSSALADGDPASDVLASQPLFAPADGGFAQSDLARLNGLLSSAQRQGAPIRVALIAAAWAASLRARPARGLRRAR